MSCCLDIQTSYALALRIGNLLVRREMPRPHWIHIGACYIPRSKQLKGIRLQCYESSLIHLVISFHLMT